jgi:hypothetical protein
VLPIPAGRLKRKPGRSKRSDGGKRQPGEPYERRLLRHLFHRDISHGKHRDPVLPVNLEHSLGVLDDDLPIKVTTTNNEDRVVIEPIALAYEPLLHVEPER